MCLSCSGDHSLLPVHNEIELIPSQPPSPAAKPAHFHGGYLAKVQTTHSPNLFAPSEAGDITDAESPFDSDDDDAGPSEAVNSFAVERSAESVGKQTIKNSTQAPKLS